MSADLASRLEENAARYPAKPAFIVGRGASWHTLTYRQLSDYTNRLVDRLQQLGVKPGSRAAVMCPAGLEFFVLSIALIKTGVLPILVDPAIGLRNVTRCLNESEPELFIGTPLTEGLRLIYGWGKRTLARSIRVSDLGILAGEAGSGRALPSQPPSNVAPETPAAIIYTSGSTGLAKGAIFSQANILAEIDSLRDTFCISPDEIDLPAFPLFALIDCLVGITAIVPDPRFPGPAKIDPAQLVHAIHKFGVSNMFASPIALARLVDHCRRHHLRLSGLKRIITAGAPAPAHVLEGCVGLLDEGAGLFGIYGATESLPITVINSREMLKEMTAESALGAGICIGKPVKDAIVRVIRITDTPIQTWSNSLELPAGEVGEITVKGPTVTRSYAGRPEANQSAKIREGEDIVHRTGDLGYFDERGLLWFCGRKSQRVILASGTLFTEEIEGVFNAHPLVYRTALVGVQDKPVLWVQLKASARNASRNKVRDELLALGRGHAQAARIETFLFKSEFPTDVRHNSKIIREQLTKLAERKLA